MYVDLQTLLIFLDNHQPHVSLVAYSTISIPGKNTMTVWENFSLDEELLVQTLIQLNYGEKKYIISFVTIT